MPDSASERLLTALKHQGTRLAARAEWLQRAIDQKTQLALNAEADSEVLRCDLVAVEKTIQALRDEYTDELRKAKESTD